MSKEKASKEQVRGYLYEYYLIEWEVPKENAIGGVAYWDAMTVDGKYETKTKGFEEAKASFCNAKLNRPEDKIRLVKVTCEVIDE